MAAQWLAADVDSEEEAQASIQSIVKKNKRKAGRHVGDAAFRETIRSRMSEAKEAQELLKPQPGSIEYARAALHEKREAAKMASAKASRVKDLQMVPAIRGSVEQAVAIYDPNASLQFVGSELQQDVVSVALGAIQGALVDSRESKDVLDFVLDTPSFASQRAISQIMKTSRAKVDTLESLAGPCLLQVNSWMSGALFSSIITRMLSPGRHWKGVIFMTSLRYDEASLKLWLKDGDGFSPHAKVLQTEFRWQCLLLNEHTEPPEYCVVGSDLLTFMQAIDHHTAENLLAATSKVMSIVPEMDRFSRNFGINMHHACTDKHSANMKCERLRQASSHPPKTTIHLACSVHKLYSATTCSMKCADRDVSGILNLGLAHQASPGAYNSLLVALAEIFRDELQVCYEDPPASAHKFREEVFNHFLPVEANHPHKLRNQKRRYILHRMLNCCWEGTDLVHYCPFQCCQDFDETLRKFVQYVCWAICPTKCPKFCRSRWTRYDESIDWCGLVASICNGRLLETLMQKTIGRPQTQAQRSSEAAAAPKSRASARSDFLTLALEEAGLKRQRVNRGEAQVAHSAPLPGDQDEPADTADKPSWAEINAKKRAEAAAWVLTRPAPRLVAIKAVVKHLLALMGQFLWISSPGWEREQQRLAAQGSRRSYQVLEAALGQQVKDCMQKLVGVYFAVPTGVAAMRMTRKLRNFFFQMTTSALCGLHSYLRVERSAFPFQWFRILLGEMDEVFSIADCLRDELASEMFTLFPTAKAAGSLECRAVTEFLASSIQLDTARIEARHSSNRETTMQRGRGWGVTMQVLNSKFVVRQHASQAQRAKQTHAIDKACGKKQKKKDPNKTHGGGAWKAFIHDRFKAHKFTRESMRMIAAEYRALTEAEYQHYVEAGRLATQAHRLGLPSFAKPEQTVALTGSASHTALDLVPTTSSFDDDYASVKLALVRARAQETEEKSAAEDSLVKLLGEYGASAGQRTIIPELMGPMSAGLMPVPTMQPFVNRVHWQPAIRELAQAWTLVCVHFSLDTYYRQEQQ